jgi:hypothetical protein
MRIQPKKNLTLVKNYKGKTGNIVRKGYQNKILDKAPIFPKPLEYNDIDNAVFNFVDNMIDIVIDDKLIPTYTLYSNQRFSEYSQMWEHSDENGNLYLNFKTLNRDKNPSFGDNQGKLWNIPGERKYTLLQREVLDDNGTESYEIYTMKQPYAVDLKYTINFVTTTFEDLNKFNQKLNNLFKSRQCYIRPNGHYLPMLLEDISDETSYSISDRKFFVQSANIKVMAYIIQSDNFEVKKYPKRINQMLEGDVFKKNKACVEVEEIDNPMKNKTLNINIKIEPFNTKVKFTFDTEMIVENIITDNVRNMRIMVNDTLYYIDKSFKLHKNDNVLIKINPIEYEKETKIQLVGYEKDSFYNSENIPEKVFEEEITNENINIE